jgi:hypothetical protein
VKRFVRHAHGMFLGTTRNTGNRGDTRLLQRLFGCLTTRDNGIMVVTCADPGSLLCHSCFVQGDLWSGPATYPNRDLHAEALRKKRRKGPRVRRMSPPIFRRKPQLRRVLSWRRGSEQRAYYSRTSHSGYRGTSSSSRTSFPAAPALSERLCSISLTDCSAVRFMKVLSCCSLMSFLEA